MRNEIKLSVKMAREDDDANAQFPPLINYDGTVTPARKCPRYREAGPTHKPGWHRAPDLAMLKSRPVDPPRERDYTKLTEAAKRKPVGWWGDERNIRDWSAFADPAKYEPLDTMPVVGDTVIFLDKGNTDIVESVLPNGSVIGKGGYCFLYEGFKTGVGRDGLPGGFNRVLKRAAPAPAPVADSAVGEFEPVGTMPVVGDRVINPKAQSPEVLVVRAHEIAARRYVYENDWGGNSEQDFASGFTRILKRKNVAARAWKENGGYQWLCIGKRWYSLSPYSGWSDYGDNFLWDNPMTGWSELTAPAEIQRLVRELRDAGLGEIKITPVL